MGKLKFYTIDDNYLNYLRENGDSKVPNHDYQNIKFYTGVVFSINNYLYFAPVSSFKEQQKTNYLIKVSDYNSENGIKVSSSVRCCYMVPVPQQLLKVLDVNTYPDIKSRGLLRKELKWCKDNSTEIKELAEKVYKWGANRNSPLSKNCCDFKKLEQAHDQYVHDFFPN